jgi:hypothetical protein
MGRAMAILQKNTFFLKLEFHRKASRHQVQQYGHE